MIVADVNIVVNLFLEGNHSEKAGALYENDPNWVLPDIWIHEMTNVLSTYVKHGGLDRSMSMELLNSSLDYFLPATVSLPMDGVLACSLDYNISAYDAEYIYLAREKNIPLITVDKRLIRSIPDHTKSL